MNDLVRWASCGSLMTLAAACGVDADTEGSAFSAGPIERPATAAETDLPPNIGLRMQYQETSKWCWIAVGTSIAHFYDPSSTVTQAALMTRIGQAINRWPTTTVCWPTASTLATHPGLGSLLDDPYVPNAKRVLDGLIPAVCVKSGGVGDALKANGNLNGRRKSLSLGEIHAEIRAGRPVVVDIRFRSGLQHVIAIAGVQDDVVLICDPVHGETAIQLELLEPKYRGGCKVVAYFLTKRRGGLPREGGAGFAEEAGDELLEASGDGLGGGGG
jgi:Papain-like cysteine protease AvrRpt2